MTKNKLTPALLIIYIALATAPIDMLLRGKWLLGSISLIALTLALWCAWKEASDAG